VYYGNGDGTFHNLSMYKVGHYPYSVSVGDFNNDKKLDLAVPNFGTNDISLLFGNGDGTFQNPMTYRTGRGPSNIITNDFNNDNKLDLVVVNELNKSVRKR
jgi:hypothetical protein